MHVESFELNRLLQNRDDGVLGTKAKIMDVGIYKEKKRSEKKYKPHMKTILAKMEVLQIFFS